MTAKDKSYLFTSARLGFRRWADADLEGLAAINADDRVMEFFSGTVTRDQSRDFIKRMQEQFLRRGFCYFAVDVLEGQGFIGFIGLSEQTYDAAFTPFVDIGWRIGTAHWNKGFATEGAERCLQYTFEALKMEKVYAVAPKLNKKSEHIMQKIGMKKVYEFDHPLLMNEPRLRTFVLYKAEQGLNS